MITAGYGSPNPHNLILTSTLVGEVSWWRGTVHPDGATSTVRLPGTGNPYTDTTAPLQGVVTYTATTDTGSETSADFILTPPAAPILSDPSDPAGPWAMCTIEQQREHVWRGATVVYPVIDRLVPLVNPIVPNERTGTMTLLAPYPGGPWPGDPLAPIRELLYTGRVLLIRTLCRTRADTLSFIVTGWTEEPVAPVAGADRRVIIDYRVADPRGEQIQPVGTLWNDVPVKWGNWGFVASETSDWAEVAYGPVAP